MKKRIFCLLLVVAMVSSLGMTAFAEPDIVEPAPQEPAAETTATEPEQPAPVPGTETPVEPAPETPAEPETPSEPTEPAEVPASETETEPVPEGEPAGDVPAAGEEVPGVEDAPVQDTAPATNDGIATISEPAPASNDGIATIGDPEPAPLSLTLNKDKESITTQNAYDCWLAYARGDDWKNDCTNGYITLTLEGAENKTDIQWSVKPDKGGASASPDGSPATTCVTVAEGNKLYLMGGTDLVGCPAGFTCTITVYATVNGTQSNTVTVTFQAPVPEPPGKPEDTTDHYEYGVWLHVENGSFVNGSGKYADISGKPSVWVEFTDGTRKLPTELPQVKATNGTFKGWYTEPPIEEMVNAEGNEYCYRQTTKVNGEQVTDVVPEGVQVLYAVFDYAVPESEETQLIQYYYDYNGMMGMYGKCLTRTGVKGKVVFTAQDAAVYNFNFGNDFGKEAPTWETLKTYWGKTTFDGYTFKGWSLDEKGSEIISKNTPVTNGMTFYAVWEKGDQNQGNFVKPSEKDASPLTDIRISSALNDSRHATDGASMTVSVYCFPVGAVPYNLTYTVTYTPSTDNLKDLISGAKTETKEVTTEQPLECEYFKAKIEGTSLVVTKVGDQACTLQVSVSATDKDGKMAQTDGGDATLCFDHQISGGWKRTKAPTCTEPGEEKAHCDTCDQDVTRTVSPLEHTWDFRRTVEPTCTKTGLDEKVCLRDGCDVKYGDWLASKGLTLTKGDEPKVVPATGHTYEVINTKIAGGVPIYTEECTSHDAEKTVMGGDANGDGRVSGKDVTKLFKVVNGQISTDIETLVGDVNGDGKVSGKDVTKLFKFVNGQVGSLDPSQG